MAAGVRRVEQGGVLIVEESWPRLEPQRQLAMVGEALCAAGKNGVGAVVTARCDVLVQKQLSRASRGRLGRFDRCPY